MGDNDAPFVRTGVEHGGIDAILASGWLFNLCRATPEFGMGVYFREIATVAVARCGVSVISEIHMSRTKPILVPQYRGVFKFLKCQNLTFAEKALMGPSF